MNSREYGRSTRENKDDPSMRQVLVSLRGEKTREPKKREKGKEIV